MKSLSPYEQIKTTVTQVTNTVTAQKEGLEPITAEATFLVSQNPEPPSRGFDFF